MMYVPLGRVHDKDEMLNAYVGNGARSLEVWRTREGYVFRGIIDNGDNPQVFTSKIDIAKFGLAMIDEIIHDATVFINHEYRKET
jgi:hypothetical protein